MRTSPRAVAFSVTIDLSAIDCRIEGIISPDIGKEGKRAGNRRCLRCPETLQDLSWISGGSQLPYQPASVERLKPGRFRPWPDNGACSAPSAALHILGNENPQIAPMIVWGFCRSKCLTIIRVTRDVVEADKVDHLHEANMA